MSQTPPPLPHLQLRMDQLKACIHCGICLPACPTYRVTGAETESPRGRLYLMKKMLEGALSQEAVAPHLSQCLACHGCETACPSGVEYGSILLAAREDLAQRDRTRGRRFKRFILEKVLPRHDWLVMLGRLLRFYQRSGMRTLVRRWNLLRRFPALARQEALLPEIPPHRELPTGVVFGNLTGEPVSLPVGCVMDVFYNPVHWDTLEVLVANGYRVTIPPSLCCGALAHHAGETDITRALARENINRILGDHPRWIVVNSAGCGSTLKEYGRLLAADTPYALRAEEFSAKIVDIMELLAQKPLTPFKNYGIYEKVAYHAACHLVHVQKIRSAPLDVLSGIPGVELVPLEGAEMCCGSAGVYNLEHPELSADILNAKMIDIRKACEEQGVTMLVTGNPGCHLQLEKGVRDSGLPIKTCHPVSLLAQAYRSP